MPSSVLRNGYVPFLYVPKHKEKHTNFLPLPFFSFHKPQVILGFLCLETIQRHLWLSYIHPTFCAFFSNFFYLPWLNLGLLELPYWWLLKYHIHSFFSHWYHLPPSNHIYVLEIFWALLFSNSRLKSCLLLTGTFWKEFFLKCIDKFN